MFRRRGGKKCSPDRIVLRCGRQRTFAFEWENCAVLKICVIPAMRVLDETTVDWKFKVLFVNA